MEHKEELILAFKSQEMNKAIGEQLIQLIREHRDRPDHENCGISTFLFKRPVEALLSHYRPLTEEEKKLFY